MSDSSDPSRVIVVDDRAVPFEDGDSIAVAILRDGAHPRHGGTICLTGDCPSCVATVDGVAYVRTCQVAARPAVMVERHPVVGGPAWRTIAQPNVTSTPASIDVDVRRSRATTVVIGDGDSGRREWSSIDTTGARLLDARHGDEVVAVYGGPTVIVRSAHGMEHIHADEVVVATGAAELHPVCPGSELIGIVTASAAGALAAAGVDLGVAVAVGDPPADVECTPVDGALVRIEGDGGRVRAVVVADSSGAETTHGCDTVIVGLGRSPRDVLARMAAPTDAMRVVGPAAQPFTLPPSPTAGVVCPCSSVTMEDLHGVWDRGFRELELVKRASLCGTGTCQGAVCGPYLRAFVAERSGVVPQPFTARPASRQITIAEAAAEVHTDVFRRTPLHDEHLALGAQMDRFGNWWRPWRYQDHIAEYWSVRRAVSVGDVSTLGKMIVAGPDAVTLLERLYPTTIADIAPGRSRYVLLLNERGHVIDDGMVLRESETRFVLTFTSGGAANAEMWIRDWAETWGLDVRILDQTMSLAAINVTGPSAVTLLGRLGVTDPPRFLRHVRTTVAGVECHVMRLSFTGEASFELHHPIDGSVRLWRALLDVGADLGIRPHGLQALFGLRLEKGHVIVGMDSELDSTPRRLGMDWAVRMDKPDFLGRSALARTAGLADERRLFGFAIAGAAPMEGSPLFDADGSIVGHASSTFTSPTLGHGIMLGWLKRTPWPTEVIVDGRRATVVDTPFYDPEGRRARA